MSNLTLFQRKMSLKMRLCRIMRILMVRSEESGLEAIGRSVAVCEEIRFEAADRQQRYDRAEHLPFRLQYC